MAARTLACFPTSTEPDTVVIFGAMHTEAGIHSLYPGGEWETPLGNLAVDEVAGAAILAEAGGLLQGDTGAHRQEHSIEVLAPMIKYFFPDVAIVPILVLPEDTAPYLGQVACRAMARLKRTTVFLASSDLTHYGPEYGYLPAGVGTRAEAWMRQNDQRLIDTLCRGTAEGVLSEARARFNACGAGAALRPQSGHGRHGLSGRSSHPVYHQFQHGAATDLPSGSRLRRCSLLVSDVLQCPVESDELDRYHCSLISCPDLERLPSGA